MQVEGPAVGRAHDRLERIGTARPSEQPSRAQSHNRAPDEQEAEREETEEASVGGYLDQDIVNLAPAFFAPRRIVVLELSSADAGQRPFGERLDPLLHQVPARFAGSAVLFPILLLVDDA